MGRADQSLLPAGEQARLLAETADFAVVWKPPLVHCVPLEGGGGETLLGWYASLFPPVMELRGKKPVEGGIVHRLDYATQGLVLFAKNQAALDSLLGQQEAGRFIKEYGAITAGSAAPLPGFPPPPRILPPGFPGPLPPEERGLYPGFIESYFRPYGPGRKAVRPVTGDAGREPASLGRPAACSPWGGSKKARQETAADRGQPYRTEIIETTELGGGRRYTALRINRGFRHQIRCHLAWTGNPIMGDRLYGARGEDPADEADSPGTPIALRAQGIFFSDPRDGSPREYRVPSLRERPHYRP
jgi:23S rRNA pseudouridine1911/1915/1917 synthase